MPGIRLQTWAEFNGETHMIETKATSSTAVGVSVSASPDMWALGLNERHLRSARVQIALYVFANGWSLAFDGDLRRDGFNEVLGELLGRYRDHPLHRETISVTSYLAWPVHIRMTTDEIESLIAEHEPFTRIVFLTLDGKPIASEERLKLCAREPTELEWTRGLTAMRVAMRKETRARVVLGGKVERYRGAMPRIAEEVDISFSAGQPVFLVGGFGGCTRDIAETVGVVERRTGPRGTWPGRHRFCKYSLEDLRNCLSQGENATLARTPHLEEMVTLVARGLRRALGNAHRQRVHAEHAMH